ncbi:MAG TPA: c-type cytochrome [Methylocystis sp.]|nr:c-type cytochrome [Methylocystis sp.]
MTRSLAVSFVFILGAAAAAAREKPEDLAAAGRDFALKVCGNCHVVEKGQTPILRPPAPSFSSIVKRQDFSEAWLRQFLSAPHGNLGGAGKMPNPRLADFEIDKVAAYLAELKNGGARAPGAGGEKK